MSDATETRPALLFVCLGNICRSPMAEGAVRAAVKAAGLDITVDSAGTADYHVGRAPDPRAIATAKRHGVDISGLAARQLEHEDYYRFTHIFAMDDANLAAIESQSPIKGGAQTALFLDLLNGRKGEAVPDPYYGDETDFEAVWQMVSEAADALVRKLAQR